MYIFYNFYLLFNEFRVPDRVIKKFRNFQNLLNRKISHFIKEKYNKSLDYLIETFDLMNEEIQIYFSNKAINTNIKDKDKDRDKDKEKEINFSQLNLEDYKKLDNEFNLEMKFERDFNILQHLFNLNFENGNFVLDPNFDFWWKEINKLIKVNIYEKISKKYIKFLY